MINFLKGIVIGLGGVAPGLSGSVLMIILGLYQKTLDALGNLLKNFKSNMKFLAPVIGGMFVGVMLFSKIIDFFLNNYEVPTRFCFLGLIVGTIPLFYKEVKKEGFSKKNSVVILFSAIIGIFIFTLNPDSFSQITNPNILQCVILGIAVAATAIVPGIDPAVFLSTLGYYEVYVQSLANFDLTVLVPMVLGLGVGAIVISYTMTELFKRYYTVTFSIIFGLFLSMIPNMLNERCVLGLDGMSFVSVILMIIGFFVSFYLGKLERGKGSEK